ncbi:MAG: hypothetical protein M9935_09355 [Kiritimatiellae bacterium]|nr:hypothetical protein [Kiritimatiellia bacterium]
MDFQVCSAISAQIGESCSGMGTTCQHDSVALCLPAAQRANTRMLAINNNPASGRAIWLQYSSIQTSMAITGQWGTLPCLIDREPS